MLPEYFQFHLPTKVIYGIGLVENLADHVASFGAKRAFVITDKIIVKNGLIEILKKGLAKSKISIEAIYDNVPPNSEISTVTEAAALGKEKNCDLIIGVGGGSVMDSAKVINVLMFKGGKIQDHMGAQLLTEKIFPMIFIPTTAGTGSEVTQYAMISDVKNDVKLPFAEEKFLPDLAVLDPRMTETMPGKVTAATGMDALTHAIEAFVSIQASPISEAVALKAVELIGANILQACADPHDMNARGGMLVGSFLAAFAIHHSGVGIVHGISHGLGGVYHVPHGLANSIILPFSIEFNLEQAAGKYARVLEALGESQIYPINEISRQVSRIDLDLLQSAVNQFTFIDEWLVKQKAKALAERLRLMNRQLSFLTGHATNLRDAGIKDNMARLEDVVTHAMEDGSMLYNPRTVEDSHVREILRTAFSQQLPPVAVNKAELKPSRGPQAAVKLRDIFKSADNLYEVLGGFFQRMADNQDQFKALAESGIRVRFNYLEPEAAIALDSSGGVVKILTGDAARKLETDVEMTLKADLAHYFWHGQLNPVQALATREVVPKGNLPKAMKLLPVLEPAYRMYPQYLKEKGLGRLALA